MAAIPASNGRAWYSVYPVPECTEPVPQLYQFLDQELEQLVYTHSSAGIQKNGWFQSAPPETIRKDNQILEWLGDSVLKGMTATLLTSMFNDNSVREGDLSAIRAALESNSFYAVICRRLGLHRKLKALGNQAMESDRVLGSLFEAYVGGVYQEIGVERYAELYNWFAKLMTPYAQAYKKYHDSYRAMFNDTAPAPAAINAAIPAPVPSSASSSVTMGSASIMPSISATASKHRRQSLSHYTSCLMEYAAKYRLNQPSFSFTDNGFDGALIQWTATVSLDGKEIASAVAGTKAEAKHLACKEALGTLKAPMTMMNTRGTRRGRKKRW